MKIKAPLLCVFITLITLTANSQVNHNFDSVRNFQRNLDSLLELDAKKFNREPLMTYPALDVFMAQKVNTYLTGTGDLSLNKSYFIIDPSDGSLFIGYNKSTSSLETFKRTRYIFTGGFKANVADAFSTIYEGKKRKWSENMGALIRLTVLGRGIISYDGKRQKQKNKLANFMMTKYYRAQTSQLIDTLMRSDSSMFEYSIRNIKNEEFQNSLRESFYDANRGKYIRKYINDEVDHVDNGKLYSSFRNWWLSFTFFIPITSQHFFTSSIISQHLNDFRLYNFEGTVTGNILYERQKTRWLGIVGVGGYIQNNINTDKMKKYSAADYKTAGGVDSTKIDNLEIDNVYLGDYSKYFTPFIRVQAVSLFALDKHIGLSFLAEKSFGKYNPTNYKIGIPFYLPGKDDDTKVNFEIQFKWTDFYNKIYPDKKRGEKFLLGISVGVPLSSKIY
ncbi:MAG: hypothetical protein J7502_04725 [Flavisolibacter sp.]|nr:hypothetical protein [Flavisolibacter sp.]